MFHKVLSKLLDWNWLRREVAKAVARWAAERVLRQDAWIRDVAVLNAVLPPGDAVAEYARRHGQTAWLRQPLLVSLEAWADALDGEGDYLAAGVRLFRELVERG